MMLCGLQPHVSSNKLLAAGACTLHLCRCCSFWWSTSINPTVQTWRGHHGMDTEFFQCMMTCG